jgi:hypothetical protein
VNGLASESIHYAQDDRVKLDSPTQAKGRLEWATRHLLVRMCVMPTSRKSGEKWGTLSCDNHRQEAGHPSVLRVAFLFRVRLVSFYN